MTLVLSTVQSDRQQRADRAAQSRHWSLPSSQNARVYLTYAVATGCLFVLGYGGANWLAGQGKPPIRVYWSGELDIPLVPAMIWPYLSINLLFLLPLFRLDCGGLRRLGRHMIIATIIAVAIFITMPTTLGFAKLDLSAIPSAAFSLLYRLDAPFNCLPSLHVTYSALIISALAAGARPWLKAALGVWLAVIMASTVLTHQHHLVDIAAALLLVAGLQFVPIGSSPRNDNPERQA